MATCSGEFSDAFYWRFLSVNADKTVIIPFTRRRQLNKLVKPSLNGKEIEFSTEVKYLGVTIDQKLTWNTHLNNIIQKAKIALGSCSRMMGNNWGLNPRSVLWLYTTIVRPTISYASVVWYHKTSQKTVTDKLGSLQRLACLMATGAMSTAPGAALNALLCLTPLSMHIAKEAEASAYRIDAQGGFHCISQRMRTLLEAIKSTPTLCMTSDIMVPSCSFQKNYKVEIPHREDWLNKQVTCEKGSLIWFTDGSKMGPNVGFGVYGEQPKLRLSQSLGKFASIFQAEVYAIIECAEANLRKNYANHIIYINSDSQAALLALNSNLITSKLVENCMSRLNTLGERNRVTLRWVPGHAGIEGNENADELARAGAEGTQYGPEPFCGVPKSLARKNMGKPLQPWMPLPWWFFFCQWLVSFRPSPKPKSSTVHPYYRKTLDEFLEYRKKNKI
ncbi:uncharacterized protein LOC114362934 [Ostrinia furnacalis]|uniref:uncharacterized protein LOC114362934 n=1 Tax=Ostrinia furnacalis TaxID=93504 RepID=UPI00103C0373|nr:uncharacterized protein LOC114362934 [Ostrinia furnacalis]